MEEIVISKKELAARGFAPCHLNGTYTVQVNTKKASRNGWIAFNCTAVDADNNTTDCTIGASVLMAVPSPIWEEDGDDIVFLVGASAVLTFQYVEGDFSASILAAEVPAAPAAPVAPPAPAPATATTTSRRGRK